MAFPLLRHDSSPSSLKVVLFTRRPALGTSPVLLARLRLRGSCVRAWPAVIPSTPVQSHMPRALLSSSPGGWIQWSQQRTGSTVASKEGFWGHIMRLMGTIQGTEFHCQERTRASLPTLLRQWFCQERRRGVPTVARSERWLAPAAKAAGKTVYAGHIPPGVPAYGRPVASCPRTTISPSASRHPLLFPESRLDHTRRSIRHLGGGPGTLPPLLAPRPSPTHAARHCTLPFRLLASALSTNSPALSPLFPCSVVSLPFDLASTRLALPVPPLPRASQGVAHTMPRQKEAALV